MYICSRILRIMKLSIITINYNNAVGLQKTVQSVVEQMPCDLEVEHIIIDGNSTDESVSIIKDYARDIEEKSLHLALTWLSEPDKGIYNAMNKGIRMASGEYVQILNSGDCLASASVIKAMYDALEKHQYPPILYGNMLKTSDWKHFTKDDCGAHSDYTPQSFLYFYNGTLNHDCAYIRRQLFDEFGFYNETMKICSDWEWYVRAIVLGKTPTVYVDIDVTKFDMNGISERNGENKRLIQHERRAYLEETLPPAILADYDKYTFPIMQYQRLKKYHLWDVAYFIERVLFKLEKWGFLK